MLRLSYCRTNPVFSTVFGKLISITYWIGISLVHGYWLKQIVELILESKVNMKKEERFKHHRIFKNTTENY